MTIPSTTSPLPRKTTKQGKVSEAALTQLSKIDQALELRRKGWTYRAIAAEMKITLKAAHRLVETAFKATQQSAREQSEELYQQQVARLEGCVKALTEQVDRGSIKAVEALVKVLDRQAKLCGLDAPTKVEQKVSFMDYTDDELLREAERLRVPLPVDVKLLPLLPGETSVPDSMKAVVDIDIDTSVLDTDVNPGP